MAQGKRSFVDKLDFVTSIGHVSGGDSRAKLGVKTKGPTKLITDLALFEPDPQTKEMTVVSIHPGVTREQIQENSGWPIKFAAKVAETPPPSQRELEGAARASCANQPRARGGRLMARDVFLCDAVRTPIGRYAGALAKVRADDLAAVPIKALVGAQPEDQLGKARRSLLRLRQPGGRRIIATLRVWRCCSPVCRPACRASRSTGCAPPDLMRLVPRRARSAQARSILPLPAVLNR
jgi:hypothetical protein